jgi:N-formylglutamate amidohydrolase
MYGHPEHKHHTVQVELNRATYMNEDSKQKIDSLFTHTQKKLARALELIVEGLALLKNS